MPRRWVGASDAPKGVLPEARGWRLVLRGRGDGIILLVPDLPGAAERACASPSAAAPACRIVEANAGAITDHARAEAIEPSIPIGTGQPAMTGGDLPAILPGARVLGLK